MSNKELTNQQSLWKDSDTFGEIPTPDSPPPLEILEHCPTEVYNTYWYFAVRRQEVFFNRMIPGQNTFTDDPILLKYKFTNTYRAADRVSQYLIRNVIYEGDQSAEEVVFRTILFKLFNKIETWELFLAKFGHVEYTLFSVDKFGEILDEAYMQGKRIYSAAYIMPSGGKSGFSRKHHMHLHLLKTMMQDGLAHKIATSSSLQKVYELLLSYPSIGKFLAYQYAIDLNYSSLIDFDENDFVVAGPGAHNGILKCFKNPNQCSDEYIIKLMTRYQEHEFKRLGLSFKSLWGRNLKLIDCQNLFCELDKYARVRHPQFNELSGRNRIKQKFKPISKSIKFWFPPKWGINEEIT